MDTGPKVDIRSLASLSRIEIQEQDIVRLADEVSHILGFVEQVQKFEVENETKAEGLRNVMREDEDAYEPGAFTDKLLSAAPKREGDYVEVKQVLAHTKKNTS